LIVLNDDNTAFCIHNITLTFINFPKIRSQWTHSFKVDIYELCTDSHEDVYTWSRVLIQMWGHITCTCCFHFSRLGCVSKGLGGKAW